MFDLVVNIYIKHDQRPGDFTVFNKTWIIIRITPIYIRIYTDIE